MRLKLRVPLCMISLLLLGNSIGYGAEAQIKLKFAMFIPSVNRNAILFDNFCQ